VGGTPNTTHNKGLMVWWLNVQSGQCKGLFRLGDRIRVLLCGKENTERMNSRTTWADNVLP
jgi:hypothetical protein